MDYRVTWLPSVLANALARADAAVAQADTARAQADMANSRTQAGAVLTTANEFTWTFARAFDSPPTCLAMPVTSSAVFVTLKQDPTTEQAVFSVHKNLVPALLGQPVQFNLLAWMPDV